MNYPYKVVNNNMINQLVVGRKAKEKFTNNR